MIMKILCKARQFSFVSLVLSSTLFLGCESEMIPPEEVFVKFYGQSGEDRAIDFVETENGFIILAQTNSNQLLMPLEEVREEIGKVGLNEPDNFDPEYGQNEVDYLLVFTDKAGNEIKSISFNQISTDTIVNNVVADSEDIPSIIRKTSDGGYLIVGTSTYTIKEQRREQQSTSKTARQSDIFIVKVNANGEKIFQKVYGDTFYVDPSKEEDELSLIANEEGADVVEHSDGYVIFGTTSRVNPHKSSVQTGVPFNPLEDVSDFFVLKILKNGADTIWQRTTGFPEEEKAINILSIGNNRSVILASTTKASQQPPGAGGTNVLFARLEGEGIIEGSGYFGDIGNEEPMRMRKVSDNVFSIVGTYKQTGEKDKAFLMEITVNSAQRFREDNIGSAEGTKGMDAAILPGIGYWIAGQVEQFSSQEGAKGAEMLLMRTNTFGVHERDFGNSTIGGINYGGEQDDELVRIQVLQSGHLVLLGTLSFGGGRSTVVCLMKTNELGKLEKL